MSMSDIGVFSLFGNEKDRLEAAAYAEFLLLRFAALFRVFPNT